jgi:hypothetical protein
MSQKFALIKEHKNKILFLVLVLALVATYVFEERANILKKDKLDRQSSLIFSDNLGELKGVTGIKINFEKRGSVYHDRENNLKLSNARLDEFFQILAGLKTLSIIDAEEVKKVGVNFYIPDPTMKMSFNFEKGDVTFILGKKLEYDQTFYMQVISGEKSNIVLVKDESPDPNVYENDEQYKKSDAKFKRLQMVYFLTNKYFYDGKVFRNLDYSKEKINFETITISTFRNKKYTVNFKDSTTLPPAPASTGYFDDNWVSFHQALTDLEAKSVTYPANFSLLDELLSFFEIVDRNGKKITLEIYKKYGEESGYFLKSSLDNLLYLIKPEDAQYFFVNVQDFWIKKISPTEKSYSLKIVFYNQKEQVVEVSDGDLFRITPAKNSTHNGTISELQFKKLIDFIKSEGNHLSDLTESPTNIIKKTILQLHFENRVLNVILEDNEVILVDLKNKLKIHHYVGNTIPFSIKYEDYFNPKK